MNNIVVATDFSACSLNAFEYAIEIAKKVKAQITMVYVNKPMSNESIYHDEQEYLEKEAKKRFEVIKKKYKNDLEEVKVEYIIREGKVAKEIVNQAKYTDSTMIITGAHGVSGFEEFLIGSNAFRIVADSDCAVITIREEFKKRGVEKIVMPIDSSLETRQKVPLVTEMAKIFNSEVHLLAIKTTSSQSSSTKVSGYAKQAVEYMKKENIECIVEAVEDDNPTEAAIEYGEKIGASLIAIMTTQEKSPVNLIIGPYAQQMVNHSPIPVLCIHGKATFGINIAPFRF